MHHPSGSGGVVIVINIPIAQSGQALWPFESQIPGSNPGRSTTNNPLDINLKN